MFFILQKIQVTKSLFVDHFHFLWDPAPWKHSSAGGAVAKKRSARVKRSYELCINPNWLSYFDWPLTNYIWSFHKASTFPSSIIWNMGHLLAGWPRLWPVCSKAFMCGHGNWFLITLCVKQSLFYSFCHFFHKHAHIPFTVALVECAFKTRCIWGYTHVVLSYGIQRSQKVLRNSQKQIWRVLLRPDVSETACQSFHLSRHFFIETLRQNYLKCA